MSKLFLFITVFELLAVKPKNYLPDSDRAKAVRNVVWPKLQNELKEKGFKSGLPVYIMLFKEEGLLEMWVKPGRTFQFFKSYNICAFSGGLGTKTKRGDFKSPEGFYSVEPKQLNPVSSYHLAINIGYPNKLETLKGYTGDQIMIHGICASNGCYAMTNDGIDEIYTMVYKAFEGGQKKIAVSIYPFRMNEEHLRIYANSPYAPFWRTLKPGYDYFNKNQLPPVVTVKNREYVVESVHRL